MSDTTPIPLDHDEIINDTAHSRVARALLNLRASMAGFTQSRQMYYEGLLFQLEVGFGLEGERLEKRIRQAGMIEATGASDELMMALFKLVATGRVTNQDMLQLGWHGVKDETTRVPDMSFPQRVVLGGVLDPDQSVSSTGRVYSSRGEEVYRGAPVVSDAERFWLYTGSDFSHMTSPRDMRFATLKEATVEAEKQRQRQYAVKIIDSLISGPAESGEAHV